MARTELTRRQHARGGNKYASDLTDAEWAVIELLIPPPKTSGRPGRRPNQMRHDARPQIFDLVDRSDQPISSDNFAGTGLRQLQRHSDGAARILDDPGRDIARCQCGRHQIQTVRSSAVTV